MIQSVVPTLPSHSEPTVSDFSAQPVAATSDGSSLHRMSIDLPSYNSPSCNMEEDSPIEIVITPHDDIEDIPDVATNRLTPSVPIFGDDMERRFEKLAKPSNSRKDWESFIINWSRMPYTLQEAISSNERPSHKDRRVFVRIIADEMRRRSLKPTFAEVAIVARKIVEEHPTCFEDRIDGLRLGCGSFSLTRQIKTRLDHLNRGNVMALRNQMKGAKDEVPNNYYGCGSSDLYLPNMVDETGNSTETNRVKLVEAFKGKETTTKEWIFTEMQKGYLSQRKDINARNPLSNIQERWPFLFLQDHFLAHFQTLTGVTHQAFLESINKRGVCVLEHLVNKSTKVSVRQIVEGLPSSYRYQYFDIALIMVVMAEFNEDLDTIILVKDVSTNSFSLSVRKNNMVYHSKYMVSKHQSTTMNYISP